MAGTADNTQESDYWNEFGGTQWVAMQETLDRQLGPIGAAMLDRADLREGERILDIGCGCGAISLEAADRVGSPGSVTGVDISRLMLDHAKQRAYDRGLSHVSFKVDDVQTCDWPETFDAAVSRLGVMFFPDPVAAFENILRAVSPGGRLAFACWGPDETNPWRTVALDAVQDILGIPKPRSENVASFKDSQYLIRLLEKAGFSEVNTELNEEPITIGPGLTLEKGLEMYTIVGPFGENLRKASPENSRAAYEALRNVLESYYTGDGIVLDSATWIVTGRA